MSCETEKDAWFRNDKKPAERNRKKDQKVQMVREDKTILNTEAELKGRIRRNLSEMFILRRIENRYI